MSHIYIQLAVLYACVFVVCIRRYINYYHNTRQIAVHNSSKPVFYARCAVTAFNVSNNQSNVERDRIRFNEFHVLINYA